ncbi:MAG: Rab family GTPase [Candidatus Hodarchaeota archaeon]
MKQYVFKVVVVGDEKVGKTSLIVRFTEKRFSEEYKPTIGIDFAGKFVSFGQLDLNLIIWDIGGQEKYKILRRHYLEGARGAILVYDITNKNSFKNLQKWLTDLDKYCGKVPIILVGNKSDLNTDRKISTNQGSEFAETAKLEFLETSAKSGHKVKDVFNMIAGNIVERYIPK